MYNALDVENYKYPEVSYQGTIEEEEISCLNKNGELEQISLAGVRNCTMFCSPYSVARDLYVMLPSGIGLIK